MKYLIILMGLVPITFFNDHNFINLDFEHTLGNNLIPSQWLIKDLYHDIHLDSNVVASGKYSLRIESRGRSARISMCSGGHLDLTSRGINSVVLKGKIKKQGPGKAYFYMRQQKDNRAKGFGSSYDEELSADGFNNISIEMSLKDQSTDLYFGCIMNGAGTAWFDAMEIWLDGKKFIDGKPKIVSQTQQEIAYLNDQIHPITSVDPSIQDSDLNALADLIGDAKIVGLGEVTHGAKEIFQLKHRIFKHLVLQEEFNHFSLESGLSETRSINDLIQQGVTDSSIIFNEGLATLHYWTWETKEFLALIQWMSEYNRSGQAKLKFSGFDMQYVDEAFHVLQAYFKSINDDKNLKVLSNVRQKVAKKNADMENVSHLNSGQINYIEKALGNIKADIQLNRLSVEQQNWLVNNATIIQQYAKDKDYEDRDTYMAENLLRIVEQNQNDKIVLSAHNDHLQNNGMTMGANLKQALKDDYVSVGFAFAKGSFRGYQGIGRAIESFPGSFGHNFMQLGHEMFMLDLRKVDRDKCSWIFEQLLFRETASGSKDKFSNRDLINSHDILIFINEVSPSEKLSPLLK